MVNIFRYTVIELLISCSPSETSYSHTFAPEENK